MIQYFHAKEKGNFMLAAEKLIRRGVENGVFPYAEWAAFDKDGIFSRGSTAGEGGRRFDLASLTKTFTATALLRLISEGKLRLEDDAASILEPPSPRLRDYLGQMSLYRLMTHTAGLPAWYPFYADGRPFFEALEALLDAQGPEEGMVYSDIGFMLLGLVLSRVSGRPLEEAIDPFGFGVAYKPGPGPDLVPSCRDNAVEEGMCAERGFTFSGFRAHFRDVTGEPNDGNAHYFWNDVSGHAGLFGTALAVARLGEFYLAASEQPYLGGVTPQPGCEGRCLVFHTGGAFPTGCGHTGFTGTSLWIDREAGLGLALLTNRLCYDHLPRADMNAFRLAVHEAILEERN